MVIRNLYISATIMIAAAGHAYAGHGGRSAVNSDATPRGIVYDVTGAVTPVATPAAPSRPTVTLNYAGIYGIVHPPAGFPALPAVIARDVVAAATAVNTARGYTVAPPSHHKK